MLERREGGREGRREWGGGAEGRRDGGTEGQREWRVADREEPAV